MFASTTLSEWVFNPRKTQRLMGREDCVGFVGALVVLGRKRGFGDGVEKEGAGAAEDDR